MQVNQQSNVMVDQRLQQQAIAVGADPALLAQVAAEAGQRVGEAQACAASASAHAANITQQANQFAVAKNQEVAQAKAEKAAVEQQAQVHLAQAAADAEAAKVAMAEAARDAIARQAQSVTAEAER